MQQSTGEKPIIVIRKVIKKKGGHHGGSWKIAYADFVTAMMAFFLLMWLLAMLNKFQLMGIANYFNQQEKNVYVDNQKNNIKIKKTPSQDANSHPPSMTSEKDVPLKAKSRGSERSKFEETKIDKKPASTENNPVNQVRLKEIADEEDKKKLLEYMKKMQNDLQNRHKIYKGQLSFKMLDDGIKVDLRDLENNPMFSPGKTDFEQHAKGALGWLSAELGQTNRKIIIIGHTDNLPYPEAASYSNWELSADRANAARRILIKYGLGESKIIQIQAFGNQKPATPDYVDSSINRRIEIIILTNKAAEKLLTRDK